LSCLAGIGGGLTVDVDANGRKGKVSTYGFFSFFPSRKVFQLQKNKKIRAEDGRRIQLMNRLVFAGQGRVPVRRQVRCQRRRIQVNLLDRKEPSIYLLLTGTFRYAVWEEAVKKDRIISGWIN
jgi:hypothetical protein